MKIGRIVSFAMLGVFGVAYVTRTLGRTSKRISMNGRVAVITGGSRGLGLAIARELATQGARLSLLARDVDELERARENLASLGASAQVIPCDVTDRKQVDRAMREVLDHWGRIDVLVNDAGVIVVGPQEHMEEGDFHEAMATHLYGPLHTIQSVVPLMRRQGGGRIVNISSIGGVLAVPHLAPYVASKFALTGLSQALNAELVKDRIYVTTVFPMTMRTGSAYNARFKGHSRREMNWYTVVDSLPLTSVGAARAARLVVQACRNGDAELFVTPVVRYAIVLAGLFPGLTARLLALVNRLLPPPAGKRGNRARSGRDMVTSLVPSVLTRLSDRAARNLNELSHADGTGNQQESHA